MKKINFKKITLILEILSIISFIVSLVIFIIKFLRTDGILSITTVTMDNLIKTTVICFGLLGVILITSLILRIIFMKIDNTDESKLIASRTIVACLVFMIILFLIFYYLCIYNTQYSIFEFLKSQEFSFEMQQKIHKKVNEQ